MIVFVSVGRVATDRQKAFVERVEAKLRNHGLEPKTIGRNTFVSDQILRQIYDLMKESAGFIAIAFERTRVPEGQELRPLPKAAQTFKERIYTTCWHHIELAIAHTFSIPVIVIAEDGLHSEGLLEDKYGWYVYRTDLSLANLETDELNGILQHWADRCKAPRQRLAPLNLETLTVVELIKSLKPSHLWAILAALAALVAGAVALGGWVAKNVPVQQAEAEVSSASSPRSIYPITDTGPSGAKKSDELGIARMIEELVQGGKYADATNLFEDLKASHFSGVGFSAYPEVVYAFDQLGDEQKALAVLNLLRRRMADDAAKGSGYLAPGRPPRGFIRDDFAKLLPTIRSQRVSKEVQAFQAQGGLGNTPGTVGKESAGRAESITGDGSPSGVDAGSTLADSAGKDSPTNVKAPEKPSTAVAMSQLEKQLIGHWVCNYRTQFIFTEGGRVSVRGLYSAENERFAASGRTLRVGALEIPIEVSEDGTKMKIAKGANTALCSHKKV